MLHSNETPDGPRMLRRHVLSWEPLGFPKEQLKSIPGKVIKVKTAERARCPGERPGSQSFYKPLCDLCCHSFGHISPVFPF